MNIVDEKYKNFQAFCLQLKPENQFVAMLQTAPMPMFLQTMKQNAEKNMTTEDICNTVMLKADINQSDVEQVHLDKFKRYIAYFREVTQMMV